MATKCSQKALELHKELEALTLNNSHSKREILKKTFISLWNKHRVVQLQQQVDAYRQLLDTMLILSVKYVDHSSLNTSQIESMV